MAAVALDEADVSVTKEFAGAWPEAVREAEKPADLDEFEALWARAKTAIDVAYPALRSLQEVVDAWDEVSEGSRLAAVSVALSALRHVAEALAAAGVELPDKLLTALSVLGYFTGGSE